MKLEIIDLRTEYDPSTKDASYLEDTIHSICTREKNKPNFLFTSSDTVLTQSTIEIISYFDESFLSGQSNTSYGCNIMVLPSQYYSIEKDKEYGFVKSALPNSDTITSNYLKVIDFHTDFTSQTTNKKNNGDHNNVIKVGVLYHKGLNPLSNDWDYLMENYIVPNKNKVYIIRRCSSEIFDVNGKNCEVDENCPDGEKCEMPTIPFVY